MRKNKKINLLRLQLNVCSSSAPHNNFTLSTKDNYNITVCSFDEPELDTPKNIKIYHSSSNVIKYILIMYRLIKNKPFDIIHAHTVHVGFLFLLSSILLNKKILKKTIFTVHNSFENYHLRNKLLFFVVHTFFNKIVYCSKSSFNSFNKSIIKSREKNIIIRNGVNTIKILKFKKKHIEKTSFRIIVVGRLVKIKQPSYIINAFNKLQNSNVELVFIGDGPLMKSLLDKNYKNIRFMGSMNRDSVYKNLFKSDIFISMSLTEGMPMAVLEAITSGLPVILSDISAHREIAENIGHVDLIPINQEIDLLKEKIKKYIDMSDSKMNEIKIENNIYINERFSLESMLKKYDDLYNKIIDSI